MEEFGKINLTSEQLKGLKTPCYIVNETRIEENLFVLKRVQELTGCKILLALKGFALWPLFPLIKQFLAGIAASSLNEARLGKEKFGGGIHVYAPAYSDEDFCEITKIANHVSFNSVNQWNYFKKKVVKPTLNYGIRVNPEHSEVKTKLYDPCAPFSRLGVTIKNFENNIRPKKNHFCIPVTQYEVRRRFFSCRSRMMDKLRRLRMRQLQWQ